MGLRNTVHVSGFPRGTRARDLAHDFERIGKVVRIDIPPARSRFARPYAFVEFEDFHDAEQAIQQLDQQPFALDTQFTFVVQLARSEPHPSRAPGAPNPLHGAPMREFGPDHNGDEMPPRRRFREGMPRERGAYGARSYGDRSRADFGPRRRELSPARMAADDGPAPYHDVRPYEVPVGHEVAADGADTTKSSHDVTMTDDTTTEFQPQETQPAPEPKEHIPTQDSTISVSHGQAVEPPVQEVQEAQAQKSTPQEPTVQEPTHQSEPAVPPAQTLDLNTNTNANDES
ncbi:LAMI_0A04258g1_1 [Lachancea mirantina]|uniref:LAMI_0A04258g1_1 n=1 Tax=Lachancea mirantina TaxID=1230905 RepID=A0A1G4INQ3_9SACH|nr:LAMI_0A04258g1_1 [Lachancea mirantina]